MIINLQLLKNIFYILWSHLNVQLVTKLNISDCHQLDSNRLTIGHNTKKWVEEERKEEETISIVIINYLSTKWLGHYNPNYIVVWSIQTISWSGLS